MELRDYFQILKKYQKTIILTVLIVVGLTLIYEFVVPPKYEATFSLLITKEKSQQTEDFQYDQYYATKTQEKIGKFIKQYLKNPAIVAQIYKQAGIKHFPYQSPRQLRNALRVYPVSAQEVRIIFSLKDPEKIAKVANIIHQELAEKIQTFYPQKEQATYNLQKTKIYTTQAGLRLTLKIIIAVIFGIILGIFIALFAYYWTKE